MKRHGGWIALTVLLGLMTALSVGPSGPTDASSVSKTSSGWNTARRYLEAQGTPTKTLDESPADGLEGSDVLVLSGSAADDFSPEETESLERFIQAGGRLVLGYSDESRGRSSREALGVVFVPSDSGSRSINPVVWREETARTLRFPVGDSGAALAMFAVRRRPVSEPGDLVLVQNDKREPLVILRPRGKGEVFLLPVEALSNGRLGEAGNAGLLEGLRTRFGDGAVWTFDEYHHGLVRATSPLGQRSRRALDLFVFQILLAYALFVLAMGRRFGAEWPEPTMASGATGSFLVTVAAIHHRLGHHAAAAAALRSRAKEVLGIDVGLPAIDPPNPALGLVAVAREIRKKQGEGHIA